MNISNKVTEIQTPADLQTCLDKTKKVCLYFWAPWCGPCVAFAPLFAEIAQSDKFSTTHFCKINIDNISPQHSNLTSQYNIKSIPTILILEKGEVVKSHTGKMTHEEFESFLQD